MPTHEGGRGYQPGVAYWVEQRLIPTDPFRDGSPGVFFKDGSFSILSCQDANNR